MRLRPWACFSSRTARSLKKVAKSYISSVAARSHAVGPTYFCRADALFQAVKEGRYSYLGPWLAAREGAQSRVALLTSDERTCRILCLYAASSSLPFWPAGGGTCGRSFSLGPPGPAGPSMVVAGSPTAAMVMVTCSEVDVRRKAIRVQGAV